MHIETEIFLYRYLNYYLNMTYSYIIAPDNIYLSMDNSPIYWPVSEANYILLKKIKQNKHAKLSKAPKLYAMATQKFKPGDKVKFTQEAKRRFDDSEYWHSANYPNLDLDRTYTVRSNYTRSWPAYQLRDCDVPYIPDYLLEPAETEQTKEKNMEKKDFILALVQAILPDQDLTYKGCKPYAEVHTGTDHIIVKCPKVKEGNVDLTLSPVYGCFEETDIELVTKFLTQNCDLNCPEGTIEVTDNGDLVMYFEDYPWHTISEIKPSTPKEPVQEEKPNPCDNCKVVRKLQAEIQRLKYELDQAKAEKSQTKTERRKSQPWAEKFDLPDGRHGIAFGFSF